MAGIIFAKNSGAIDNTWKDTDKVIRSWIMDADTEKNNDDELVKALYNVKKSDSFGEKIGGLTEFGNFEPVVEGGKAIQDSLEDGFDKLIQHTQFMKSFVCTAEAKEDNKLDMMKIAAQNFVRSYKRSRAQFASDALVTEGSSFIYGGKTFDKTTGDGKGLFATDHLGKKVGVANQSNVFTDALGNNATNLYKLANIGRNFKNSSGNVMGYTFDTIVIPGDAPEEEDLIKRIIHSEQIVGSANNDINTQKNGWKLVVNHRWQKGNVQKTPYILMSSEANRELMGSLFYDRIPLTMTDWVDEGTANLNWMGRARMSAGFGAWQAFILGGAQAGSNL